MCPVQCVTYVSGRLSILERVKLRLTPTQKLTPIQTRRARRRSCSRSWLSALRKRHGTNGEAEIRHVRPESKAVHQCAAKRALAPSYSRPLGAMIPEGLIANTWLRMF
jgi:hypothetical protein